MALSGRSSPWVPLLLLIGTRLIAAAPSQGAAGRRLLSEPDGERPWRVGAAADADKLTVILMFNQLAQLAVRNSQTGLQLAAKYYAMVHLAQRTAIVKVSETPIAAAAYAGHGVLGRIFPLMSPQLDAVMPQFTAGLSKDKLKNCRDAVRDIVATLVTASLSDGTSDWADWYVPPAATMPPGVYRFTPGQTFALLPQLAKAKPLVIPSATQFDQGGPFPLNSTEFANDFAEVQAVGTAATTTPFRNETACYWMDGAGTHSAAGHWSDIAANLLPLTTSLAAAADLFYRLNAAMFDASVACWAAKYKYNHWRPVTAISYLSDPSWTPLFITPFHPEHPSGHSCAGGAAGAVLTAFFGTPNMTFTVGSEFPNWQTPSLPTRTYNSFPQAVQDGKDSRVYAGVHFRRAVDVGAAIGDAVGKYVWAATPPFQ